MVLLRKKVYITVKPSFKILYYTLALVLVTQPESIPEEEIFLETIEPVMVIAITATAIIKKLTLLKLFSISPNSFFFIDNTATKYMWYSPSLIYFNYLRLEE